jgi:hypothetical protein
LSVRLIAAGLLIVGALAAVGFARREDRIHQQQTLAAVGAELAGRPVAVRCPGFLTSLVRVRAEAGQVKFDADGRPANYTELSPETCSALRHIDRVDFACLERSTCSYKEFKVAWAAHTLAHEAFHLRGFQAEAIAECYALQNTAFVAERLGVDAATAQRLQRWVYTDGYPNEPEDYRSDECRDGGRLDLRPQSAAFP